MKVIYLRSFLSDLKKIKDQKIKNKIKILILEIKGANLLEDVENIKKLKGYSMAYRSRIGDYRVGMYKEFESVELARFVKRNDIYKVFPKKGAK
ncbi:plasmid stabilization protein [Formosa sp. Hel1_33_131]|jgi:mRNA interferase RelE/StbE|uniref:plasmid stabilization protein n=1 Tax=Formosa sp. Hel1_33_131 TaxID=1336794 RepID=UPI00084E23FD|nr:plasmid stabilization protein [Formosa sp. Hel1_33_131]AOR28078.1 plasmid stabilization protein [Formosa sp. Hel1_33_131]